MHNKTILGGAALAAGLVLASFSAGAAAAAGDPAVGKTIFERTCETCHSLDIGVNKVGPSLNDIIGRKAGAVQGFEYSEAVEKSGAVWTVEELDAYLSNPQGTVHGVKMAFTGLKDPRERADVIAYLQSLQK